MHARQQPITEVVITDRYLLLEESEDGKPATPWKDVTEYLKVLRIDPPSAFSLKVNGRLKSGYRLELFRDTITAEYPRITLVQLPQSLDFHDRLYLAGSRSGDIRGVFGPSLNALDTPSIVVLGELEPTQLGR